MKNHFFPTAGNITQASNYFSPLCILLLTMISVCSRAQVPPLKPTDLFDRSEVIMVWDEGSTNGAVISEENLKLKFNYQGLDVEERLTSGGLIKSDTTLSFDTRQFDLISGDFNNDNMAEYLYSYTADNDSLHLIFAKRQKTLNFPIKNTYKFDGRVLPGKNLIQGDLNGDDRTEFVVGYRNFDSEWARIAIFSFNAEFEIEYETYIGDFSAGRLFVVDLCDLDGDGDDELAIGFSESLSSLEYHLKIYDFDADFNPIAKAALVPEIEFNANEARTAALTGVDYDNDGKDELVLALTKNEYDQPNNPDTYLYTAKVMDDPYTDFDDPLEMITCYSDQYTSGRYNYGGGWPILLKSGDVNGDSIREIVLGAYGGIYLFDVVENNHPEIVGPSFGTGSFDEFMKSVNYFDVADISGDDHDDVVTLNHFFSNEPVGTQSFSLQLFQFDSAFNSTTMENVNQLHEIPNGGGGGMHKTKYAVSLSDFDGDLFRIGEYTSMGCFSNVVRPLTVLNTPPVHIDYIDGTVHDVNECYGKNDCQSRVQKSTSEYVEEEYSIETSSTGDWGFDPEVNVGVEAIEKGTGTFVSPVEVSSYFGGNLEEVVYDEKTTTIGKSTSVSRFQTASMDSRYSRDDAILTIVSDYQRWEYPVYNEYDEKLGEIIILIPETTNDENWLRGRQILEVSGLAQLHEQGNLLSYRKIYEDPADLMAVNPDIKELITIANEHELDLGATYTESITWSSEFENQDVSIENIVETPPSGGISILGTRVGVDDKSIAEEETITSHIYKVGSNLGIEVYGSSLAANSYEYKVKPYYYWSKNGALSVDYMVDLSQGSFWQDNYGIQDPGFLLPNRLDSLKAKNEIDKLTNLEEYLMTPSILFDPAIPVNGDTVEVSAIIHNLSITPTDGDVEVSFYVGDPAKGGTIISDLDGKTVFTTEGSIQDQEYDILNFSWKANFKQNDRLYALIDPANKLNEAKEDNNKAWTPIQRYVSCGDALAAPPVLYQSTDFTQRFRMHPNPANSLVTIQYSGPIFSNTQIKVTDAGGKTYLTNELAYQGTNEVYYLNISDLPTGFYLLSFTTDNYTQVTKFIKE